MTRPVVRRAALFAIICTIAVSLVSAAEGRAEERAACGPAGIARLFRALPELWTSLTRVFMNEGSSLDPSGNLTSPPPPLSPDALDEGSSLDPSGR